MDKVKFFRFAVIVFLLTVAVAPGLAQKKGLAAAQTGSPEEINRWEPYATPKFL